MEVEGYRFPVTQWPCIMAFHWVCEDCGAETISTFRSMDVGDDDMDCFDYDCECGRYYKKFCRVPEDCILDQWWYPLYFRDKRRKQ